MKTRLNSKYIAIVFSAALVMTVSQAAVAGDGQEEALRGALKQALIENNTLRTELKAAREEIEKLRTMMMERAASQSQPGANPYAALPSPQRTHTVSSGETLGSIAAKYYGFSGKYRQIYEANRGTIKSPNSISPGQVLTIP